MGSNNSAADDEREVTNDAEISIIVWFDPAVNKTIEKQKAQQQLCTIVNRFKAFEDAYACEEFIRTVSSNERILLIVNNQQGKQVISHAHSYRQVISIYLHSNEKNEWTKKYPKVEEISTFLEYFFVFSYRSKRLLDDSMSSSLGLRKIMKIFYSLIKHYQSIRLQVMIKQVN